MPYLSRNKALARSSGSASSSTFVDDSTLCKNGLGSSRAAAGCSIGVAACSGFMGLETGVSTFPNPFAFDFLAACSDDKIDAGGSVVAGLVVEGTNALVQDSNIVVATAAIKSIVSDAVCPENDGRVDGLLIVFLVFSY